LNLLPHALTFAHAFPGLLLRLPDSLRGFGVPAENEQDFRRIFLGI
jgi:hypothetical protein